MFFDLTRLRDGQRERVERRLVPGDLETGGDDFAVRDEVTLSFDIERTGDHYRLAGRVVATLDLPCSRCLERFAWPVDVSFELRYLPQVENTGEDEREVGAEDLQTAYHEDGRIDLDHLLHEQFYLAMPMKPLCAPACQGLCPTCGTNRNVGPCACVGPGIDPRLAPLERWLHGQPADD